MRRLSAMSLLALFSFSLIGPAVFADSDSRLPACCRRLGEHRCDAVQDIGSQQSSGSTVSDARPKCPLFPLAHAVPVYGKTMLAASAQAVVAALPIYPIGFVRTEAGSRVSISYAHQKRGPPVLV